MNRAIACSTLLIEKWGYFFKSGRDLNLQVHILCYPPQGFGIELRRNQIKDLTYCFGDDDNNFK